MYYRDTVEKQHR